jgi:hypothetical protein
MSRPLRAKSDSVLSRADRLVVFMLALVLTVSMALAQQPLNDKQLFQRAEKEFAAGKLDEAYVSVKEARTKKGKPDKKYDDLYNKVSQQLADREAAPGEAACNANDLAKCEAQLKKAKEYGPSADSVKKLDGLFNQKLSALQTRFKSAVDLAATDPDEALKRLGELNQYRSYLPELSSQTERVRSMAVNKHATAGAQLTKEEKWDEAATHYNKILELSSNDPTATTGLKDIARLREASRLHTEARALLQERKFEQALTKVDKALEAAPDKAEYKETRQRIRTDWAEQLANFVAEGLTGKVDDFEQTRITYLNFEQLRNLDKAHPALSKFGSEPSVNFAANLLLKSADLEAVTDYSRIGSAAIMKVKAQQLLATVKPEELKDIFGYFDRRRRSQLVITTENLATKEAETFVSSVTNRSRSAVESAELPDLAIRDLESYRRSPDDDPVVKGLSPDGRSSTALLTASITGYESTRTIVDKTKKSSQYRIGSEEVPNPDYTAMVKEIDAIQKEISDPKNKKKEIQTELKAKLDNKERQLTGITPKLVKDKVADYEYEQVTYSQRVNVEVTLTLRDLESKQNIAREVISSAPALREMKDTEIRGVHPQDVKGVREQPPTMLTESQALREAERQVLEQITSKTLTMLPKYTKRFYAEGHLAMEQGRVDDALENFICHWGFFRGRVEKGELDTLSSLVYSRTGFDFQKDGRILPIRTAVRP